MPSIIIIRSTHIVGIALVPAPAPGTQSPTYPSEGVNVQINSHVPARLRSHNSPPQDRLATYIYFHIPPTHLPLRALRCKVWQDGATEVGQSVSWSVSWSVSQPVIYTCMCIYKHT